MDQRETSELTIWHETKIRNRVCVCFVIVLRESVCVNQRVKTELISLNEDTR